MIKAGQIEKGTALLIKGQPFLCIEREFVNPGKGSAFVRLKLKSPSTGQTLQETMKSQDNAEDITIEDGIKIAREALESGLAAKQLDDFAKATKQ